MFTKEYVSAILAPFVGEELRMAATDCIPFCLETSMESSFQIELTETGIRFLLKDNHYIEMDLDTIFRNALKVVDISPRGLDTLLKGQRESWETDAIAYDAIISHIKEGFNPQIAFTYYTMIKSLTVNETSFLINNVKFFIAN